MANRWRLTIEKPFCYRMRWFVLETTIAGRLLIYFLLFISSNITTLTAKRSAMDAAVTPATPMPVYISITDECIVSTEAYIHICSITVLFNVKKTFNCLRGCGRTYNSFLLITDQNENKSIEWKYFSINKMPAFTYQPAPHAKFPMHRTMWDFKRQAALTINDIVPRYLKMWHIVGHRNVVRATDAS